MGLTETLRQVRELHERQIGAAERAQERDAAVAEAVEEATRE